MYALGRTLVVRFSATMFVAILAISGGAYLGVRRVLSGTTDRGLESGVEMISDVLAAGLSVARSPDGGVERGLGEVENWLIAVRDTAGNVVAHNSPFAGRLPLSPAPFARAVAGGRGWATESSSRGHLRSLYAAVPPGAHPGFAVVQVSASLRPVASLTQVMLAFGVLIVLVTTAATAVGAWWLASSVLVPVRTIAAQAAGIEPGVGNRKITAHADTREFRGLVDVLNSMVARLDHAFRAQRRMIADVAHELRTPITSLHGQLEVALRSDRTAEEYRRFCEGCLEDTARLVKINEATLTLARLQSGDVRPKVAPIAVAPVAAELIEEFARADGSRRFTLGQCDDTATIVADEYLVRYAVRCVLENARVHTPPGTHVECSVTGHGTHVDISIDDDGPGVADEHVPALFEGFYRVDPARAPDRGFGLGLTIAAAVAGLHGGDVGAARSAGGGLRVVFHFPSGAARSVSPAAAAVS